MLKELSKSKPKRGAAFTHPEHGQVFLDRIKEDGTYFVQVGYGYTVVDPKELKAVAKVRKPIGNNKKPLTLEEKRFKADLDIFYEEALNELPDKCQECGEDLGCLSAWDARCCTAHILEKNENSGFPSIACHPVNKVFLGNKNCSCHTRYDKKGAEFRSTMKIYPVVLAAFEILKEYLTDKEIVKAKKYLNIKS